MQLLGIDFYTGKLCGQERVISRNKGDVVKCRNLFIYLFIYLFKRIHQIFYNFYIQFYRITKISGETDQNTKRTYITDGKTSSVRGSRSSDFFILTIRSSNHKYL